ncbi:MAG: transcriptional regulator [Clostridia bacterium]|jgi:predicted DNA-binding transcriptional regulator YafY|nr:transcriptional regulator [Clostridia bacterium]
MKINRMVEIITILLNKKMVTAKELADRFEVSVRTIYRDIDILSGAGIPIYTSKGNGGGIALLEHYTLDKAVISESESQSLMLGLTALKATNYPNIDKMLEKLSAVFKQRELSDWIEVDFTPWGVNPNSYHKFEDIKQGILYKKVLEFDYINTSHERIKRKVEPIKLIFKSKEWYMWGFCRMRNEFRLFKLSRIRDHVLQDEVFERKSMKLGVENQEAYETPKGQALLRLRFKEAALYRLYDEFDDEFIQNNEDGTYEVTVDFPEGEWVYGYILSFGGDVEVIEPVHIRAIIMQKLDEAIKRYRD